MSWRDHGWRGSGLRVHPVRVPAGRTHEEILADVATYGARYGAAVARAFADPSDTRGVLDVLFAAHARDVEARCSDLAEAFGVLPDDVRYVWQRPGRLDLRGDESDGDRVDEPTWDLKTSETQPLGPAPRDRCNRAGACDRSCALRWQRTAPELYDAEVDTAEARLVLLAVCDRATAMWTAQLWGGRGELPERRGGFADAEAAMRAAEQMYWTEVGGIDVERND